MKRFWDKVNKSESGCWLWTSCGRGYGGQGSFKFEGKTFGAHRFAWELVKGPIPHGMCVLHKCDVPKCVNPDHLFIGTQVENIQDRDKKERQARGEKVTVSKLTAEQVLAIRADRRSDKAIADDYGVFFTAISKIKRRITWKHIPPHCDDVIAPIRKTTTGRHCP